MIVRKKYLVMGLLLLCLVGSAVFYPKSNAGESVGKVEIKWLYPPKYYFGTHFSEGRAWVQEQKKGPWTLLDDQGNILKTGFEADAIKPYRDGIVVFHNFVDGQFVVDGKLLSGFANRSGDVVLSPDFYAFGVGLHSEGLITQHVDAKDERHPLGLYGFIDMKGEWVIPAVYDSLFEFNEGLAPVSRGGRWGFIDKTGAVSIDIVYDYVLDYSHGMAVVSMVDGLHGSQFGVIDREGNLIAEIEYDRVFRPWSNLIGLQKNGKVGFIDSKGNVVIDFKFPPIDEGEDPFSDSKGVYCFSQGRAAVITNASNKKEPEYGIIDESGTVLFKTGKRRFTYIGDFVVERNAAGEKILIDRNGRKYELPPEFRSSKTKIVPLKDNIFWVRHKGKVGYFLVEVEGGLD